MNKEQINKFVKLASGENIPVFYSYDKDVEYLFMVPFYRPNTILANEYYLGVYGESKNTYLKMGLLHEIGHIKTATGYNNRAISEYRAQMWGLNRARELNMSDVYKEGIRMITKYWKKIYKGCRKEHVGAHKIYMSLIRR